MRARYKIVMGEDAKEFASNVNSITAQDGNKWTVYGNPFPWFNAKTKVRFIAVLMCESLKSDKKIELETQRDNVHFVAEEEFGEKTICGFWLEDMAENTTIEKESVSCSICQEILENKRAKK